MGINKYKRRGVALIWVAIFGLLIILMVGLALDTSYLILTSFQLQNSADAAALAGAMVVRENAEMARDQAVAFAAANEAAGMSVTLNRNDGNASEGDIVLGYYDRDTGLFDPLAGSYNAVKVVARRTNASSDGPVSLVFGPVVGKDTAEVYRSAIAIVGGATGAGLITLSPTDSCALNLSGNNDLVINTSPDAELEGSIQVNSADPCAMCTDGSALTIEAGETNIVGDICMSGNPTLNTTINPDSSYVPDPLAGIPESPITPPDLGSITAGGTYGPGYYAGGLRITSTGETVVLDPGIYVLDGHGLYVNGGDLIAQEVMFYIIGSGSVYLGGNGLIEISPISDEGNAYWGISIFQARDNHNDSVIIGTSDMDLEGTYYFPSANLEIGGSGIALGNQLIAWTMWIHGRGTFDIQYDGRYPAPGTQVTLVE